MKIAALGVSCMLSAAACAGGPKYVFMFIGDGFSVPQRMVAEEFSREIGRGELTCNHLPYHATTRTSSATSLVTDSAAAGTAIACGAKTYNSAVGVDKDGNPVESVAEQAHRLGRKVGIVSDCYLTHATPAVFYAHNKNRGRSYQIGLEMIGSGFEYFAGGGFSGKENDVRDEKYRGNIYDLAAKAGYLVATNKADLMSAKPGTKVLYTACEGHMPHAIDRDASMPSLAEMTRKGVELLDGPAGFFMMVEGGTLDFSGHANDAATNLREVLAMDDAVRVAKEFQDRHPDDTLIITTGDHETGGMAMGFYGTGYAIHVKRLSHQKCSRIAFKQVLKDKRAELKKANKPWTFEEAQKLLEEYFAFDFSAAAHSDNLEDKLAGGKYAAKTSTNDERLMMTSTDVAALKEAFKRNKLQDEARRITSEKAGVGWSSSSHTALPVLTTSGGPGAETFHGYMDNTEIALRLKKLYE